MRSRKARNGRILRALSLMLVFAVAGVLLVGYTPVSLGDGLEWAEDDYHDVGYLDDGSGPPPTIHDANEQAVLETQAALPSSYSSLDKGYVTPVRNQGPYGVCWAFASIGAIEATMVKGMGYDASTLDLSERHLSYYRFHRVVDPLGNTAGDSMTLDAGLSYLSLGPNFLTTTLTMWGGYGPAWEADAPYEGIVAQKKLYDENRAEFFEQTALPDDIAYEGVVRVRETRHIPLSDRDDVKRAIMECGGVSVAYRHENRKQNETGWYTRDQAGWYMYCNENLPRNHAVVIVGWDDSIPADRFVCATKGNSPAHDGAWFVKNSYGAGWGNNGYFWLSYEDVPSFVGDGATAYTLERADAHGHLYQYDGTIDERCRSVRSGGSVANSFVAKAGERGEVLEAVSFSLASSNVDYAVEVYLDPIDEGDPTSGTAALPSPAVGRSSYAGIQHVELDKPVELLPGMRFAVVVTLSHADGSDVDYRVDESITYRYKDSEGKILGDLSIVNSAEPGQSFVRSSASSAWEDLSAVGVNVRVKAHTSDADVLGSSIATIRSAEASDVPAQEWTGSPLMPKPTLVYRGRTLVEGRDYTLAYDNNTDVGTATITAAGLGKFKGTKRVTFEIVWPASFVSGTWGDCPWSLDPNGNLAVLPGKGAEQVNKTTSPWVEHAPSIKSARFVGHGDRKVVAPKNCQYLLKELDAMVTADLSGLDTSKVVTMHGMFYKCSSLASLDTSGWDTGEVTNMYMTFLECSSLTSLDLTGWDTSKVTTMYGMFHKCTSLSSLNVSGWDTSKVTATEMDVRRLYLAGLP